MKITVTEMKNAFDGLVGRLDTTEERVSMLQIISVEVPKPYPRNKDKNYIQLPRKHARKKREELNFYSVERK